MPERSSLAAQTEGLSRPKTGENSKDPLTATSVTAILLELLAKYSSENNQELSYQDREEAAHSFLTMDYSFDYTPYSIDYSYFKIENYGEVDYLRVDIPSGLKVEINRKLQYYSWALKKDGSSHTSEEIEADIESHKSYLESSIVHTMLAIAYQQEIENSEKGNQVWALIAENRYSIQ